jgi:hypothetical protein
LQEREVGQGVADVGEVVAKPSLKSEELAVAGKIDVGIGGENASEETEVVGDAVGEDSVGGGGKVNGTAHCLLLLEILKKLAVVGEVSYVELDGVGEVLLESGFALGKPAGKLQKRGRMMAGENQGGVDESVRLDEGSVEVDAEHGRDCDGVGSSVRNGQNSGLPWINAGYYRKRGTSRVLAQLTEGRYLHRATNVIIKYP